MPAVSGRDRWVGVPRFLRAGLGDWRLWGLVTFLQIPALRTAVIHLPMSTAMAAGGLLGVVVLYAALLHAEPARAVCARLFSPRRIALVLVLVTVVAGVAYPRVDDRKYEGQGSDRDNALRQTARRLITGQRPLYVPTYLGNAPSPGPIWALVTAPITAFRFTYVLLVPTACAVLLWLIRVAGGDARAVAVGFVLVLSSAGWWRMAATGSDIGAVGVVFAGLVVILHRWSPRNVRGVLLGLVLLAVAASTRVALAGPAMLLGLFVWHRHRASAIGLAAFTALVLVAHLAVWPPGQGASPAHVLNKGLTILGPAGVALAVAATVATGLLAAAQLTDDASAWWGRAWLVLAVPLLMLAVADFTSAGWDPVGTSTGAFLGAAGPLLIGHAALRATRAEVTGPAPER